VVQNALDVAAKARTTVCIAHRLSTIKDADNIVVVSRGEIVEQGTHDHLIALGGVYKGLVEAQRISAEQVKGIEKAVAEGEEEEEEINQMYKIKSLDSNEMPLGLSRTKTGKSITSIADDKDFTSAGLMPQTQYSNYQLLKKVPGLVAWADGRG
jgi:ATP-binding cassette, subfamily B (MDR/TAP), member 1